MTIQCRPLAFAALFIAVARVASAATVVIRVEWEPPLSGDSNGVMASLAGPSKDLDGQDAPDGRSFTVSIGEELVFPVIAELDGSIPAGYGFQRLSLAIPFYRYEAIGIVLAPTHVDDSVEAVRDLWSTNIAPLGSESLTIFYQRSLLVTKSRLGKIDGNDDVSIWDAKSVYKTLEASFAISKVTDIEVASDAIRLRETLEQWIEDPAASKRVETGVGLDRARRLAADLQSIEVPRFTKLLNKIQELECSERKSRLEQFRVLMGRITHEQRRMAIWRGLGVDDTEVLSRINLCVIELANQATPPEGIERAVKKAIDDSTEKIGQTKRRKNIDKLTGDIRVLKNVERVLRGRINL